MFSTINSVKEYTGYDLLTLNALKTDKDYESRALILRAQAIVEAFIGKSEIDIDNPSDLLILDKMTAYQTAYMFTNEAIIYEQIAVTSQGQTDYLVNFNDKMMSPWIAPLAVITSNSLSWNKSKSIRTGKIFQKQNLPSWKNY